MIKKPISSDVTDRYGLVGDRYEIVDYKVSYDYRNGDETFFPRMSHTDQGRPSLYKLWMGLNPNGPLPANRPNFGDNLGFFFRYQIGWMYVRYFMWNFVGRQNAEQGYYPWDLTKGHWLSGIGFIDSMRLYDQSNLPDTIKNDLSRNTYFFIPFILGFIGLFFHFREKPYDAFGLLVLFIMTGIGIIIYSNQPPNEPRERDYVLVGSFFTFCMWIGMSVPANRSVSER